MSWELAGLLVGLALADSTSFGTLLVPVWLLLAPGRVRVDRVLVYLASIAGFYLALGLVLLAAASALADELGRAVNSTPGYVVALVAGVGLVLLGSRLAPLTAVGKRRREARRAGRPGGAQKLLRWRDRAVAEDGSARALAGLAVGAAAVEAASMLPYLGAIAALTASSAGPATQVAALTVYCVVMVLPAIALLTARVVLHDRVTGVLGQVDRWLTRSADELTGTVVFLLGLLLVAHGADGFGWLALLD